jgi:hypothetical protein
MNVEGKGVSEGCRQANFSVVIVGNICVALDAPLTRLLTVVLIPMPSFYKVCRNYR